VQNPEQTESKEKLHSEVPDESLCSVKLNTTTRQCYSPTTLLHKTLAVPNIVMAIEAWLSGYYS